MEGTPNGFFFSWNIPVKRMIWGYPHGLETSIQDGAPQL